ncbi:hypothetical protein [Bacillus sp. 7884-1]|uniref:hypothetical protein n=1 Tax=Bacillus sp. 7884-1 TaxID=2021693 RepID=UPI0015C6ECC5|nr:hypothetical protein [Bacillus sp. 7884-1]
MPHHFGLKVLEGKRKLKLTREKYAIVSNKNSLVRFSSDIYADEEGKIYTDEWCENQLKVSLKNYDLNMEYFSTYCYVREMPIQKFNAQPLYGFSEWVNPTSKYPFASVRIFFDNVSFISIHTSIAPLIK